MSVSNLVPIEDLRLLRAAQVFDLVPLSASQLRRLEAEGKFPKRIALSSHSVAWRESEVRAFLEDRISGGKIAGKGAAQPAKPAAKKPRGGRA